MESLESMYDPEGQQAKKPARINWWVSTLEPDYTRLTNKIHDGEWRHTPKHWDEPTDSLWKFNPQSAPSSTPAQSSLSSDPNSSRSVRRPLRHDGGSKRRRPKRTKHKVHRTKKRKLSKKKRSKKSKKKRKKTRRRRR